MTKVQIPYSIIDTACGRWDSAIKKNSVQTMTEFLSNGEPLFEGYDVRTDCWFVSEEVARRIDLLCGPHWHAIIRAWEYLNEDISKEITCK